VAGLDEIEGGDKKKIKKWINCHLCAINLSSYMQSATDDKKYPFHSLSHYKGGHESVVTLGIDIYAFQYCCCHLCFFPVTLCWHELINQKIKLKDSQKTIQKMSKRSYMHDKFVIINADSHRQQIVPIPFVIPLPSRLWRYSYFSTDLFAFNSVAVTCVFFR